MQGGEDWPPVRRPRVGVEHGMHPVADQQVAEAGVGFELPLVSSVQAERTREPAGPYQRAVQVRADHLGHLQLALALGQEVSAAMPAGHMASWVPPGLSGELACSCYIVQADGHALIIDTGLAAHWEQVRDGLDAALADNPIAGSPASIAMMTKGGVNAAVKGLSSEYAREHIRFNAVAPGVVDSPLHANTPKELLEKLTPMASITTVEDIANAVLYLTEAGQITGEVLHVDGGAHIGKW